MSRAARSRHNRLAPYLLVAPFVVVFLTFSVYPLLGSVTLAAEQTYGPKTSEFVGLKNFQDLLRDPSFWKAARNTVVFTLGSVALQIPIALALAMLLNRPKMIGRTAYRLIFFAPQMFGMVFVGILASVVFAKRTGLANRLLAEVFGAEMLEFPWLERYVMPALILANIWLWIGNNMVFFLAALQNVDRSLRDAAVVDGAGAFTRFRAVTIPAIAPTLSFIFLISLIGAMQVFELPFVLFAQEGGGPNDRALTIVMYLYQTGFETGDLGYASAVGWMLAIVLTLLAITQRMLARDGGDG